MQRTALILGGGPAGAVAGKRLLDRGLAVTLVEAKRFPRDKVCGECLSALGLATLDEVGLGDVLQSLQPASLRRSRIVTRRGRRLDLDLPAEMAGVTRSAMDAALLNAVQNAGATVIQPAVGRLTTGGIEVRDLKTNEVQTLCPDVVVLADGKSSFDDGPPPATGDFGVKVHLRNVDLPTDTIALFGLRGHYVGVAPVSDGDGLVWNLAMSVPAERLKRFGRDFDGLLSRCRSDNAALDVALGDATVAGNWLTCPLPRFAVRRDWPRNVIPIGNAAAALEPIGGEGMGLAMHSAMLGADAIASDVVEVLPARFDRLWRRRRAACRATAVLVSGPFSEPAILLAQWCGPMTRWLIRGMGKRDARGDRSIPFPNPRPTAIS